MGKKSVMRRKYAGGDERRREGGGRAELELAVEFAGRRRAYDRRLQHGGLDVEGGKARADTAQQRAQLLGRARRNLHQDRAIRLFFH